MSRRGGGGGACLVIKPNVKSFGALDIPRWGGGGRRGIFFTLGSGASFSSSESSRERVARVG